MPTPPPELALQRVRRIYGPRRRLVLIAIIAVLVVLAWIVGWRAQRHLAATVNLGVPVTGSSHRPVATVAPAFAASVNPGAFSTGSVEWTINRSNWYVGGSTS